VIFCAIQPDAQGIFYTSHSGDFDGADPGKL